MAHDHRVMRCEFIAIAREYGDRLCCKMCSQNSTSATDQAEERMAQQAQCAPSGPTQRDLWRYIEKKKDRRKYYINPVGTIMLHASRSRPERSEQGSLCIFFVALAHSFKRIVKHHSDSVRHVQNKQSDLLLLLFDFLEDREESHGSPSSPATTATASLAPTDHPPPHSCTGAQRKTPIKCA